MGTTPEPAIRIRVDPTNPGQFFACCGLLELADRLWSGADGWFDERNDSFFLRSRSGARALDGSLLVQLARCVITNAMTSAQLARRDELAAMHKREREADADLEAEKKVLDALWREAPVLLHGSFDLRVDWFLDDRAGGSLLKTWAGQQSVLDIARGMKAPISDQGWAATPSEDWLFLSTGGDCLPFNFDSALGGLGADRDVGFSLDPLKEIRVRTRPVVEFAAFVGLQRFRPLKIEKENRFQFSLWYSPLPPCIATAAATGVLDSIKLRTFEFRLLYRTKYLKSFLPANPVERRVR